MEARILMTAQSLKDMSAFLSLAAPAHKLSQLIASILERARSNQALTEQEARTLMRYYGVRHWGNSWEPFGSAQRVADRIREYRDAGAQTVIMRFAAFDQMAQLERFADGVLHKLR